MSFSFLDMLENYQREDVKVSKDIIQNRWKMSAEIIKEAFSQPLTNRQEAVRIIKNELTESHKYSAFLKEHLDYVVDKMETLSEGDIKIIINNGDKKAAEKAEVLDVDEGVKRTRGRPKKVMEEKKKDKEEEEVIVDEPVEDAPELTVDDEEKNVVIKVIKDEETVRIVVEENGETIEDLVVSEDTIDAIVDFLKSFYDEHEYNITIDKGEDEEGTEGSDEGNEEGNTEIEVSDENLEEPVEEAVKESVSTLKWLDLFTEDEDFTVSTNEIDAEGLVGKIALIGGDWVTIVGYDAVSDEVEFVDANGETGTCSIADIEDYEKDMPEIDVEMTDDYQESVESSESVIEEAKKAPSTGSYTKTANMKPKLNMSDVKKPKTVTKKAPQGNYTSKGGQKTMQKVEDVKKPSKVSKNAPVGTYSKSPAKPNGKKEDVKKPKVVKKAEPKGSFTKTGGMKTLQKQAQGSPKAPKTNCR